MSRKKSRIPDHVDAARDPEKEVADLESSHPEARVAVGRTARERQLRRNPERKPANFRVTYQDRSEVIKALDPNEAWAKFCDGQKTWPSPANRVIVRLADDAPEPPRLPEPSGEASGESLADI